MPSPIDKTILGPFGNPDGSRADLDDLFDGFVSFSDPLRWGGLATRGDDRSARVLIGRKGSGKTVYLRRIHAAAVNEASLYADDIQQGNPSTESILRFCQLFPANVLTERWTSLWRRAILLSVRSHLLHAEKLKLAAPPTILAQLQGQFDQLIPPATHTPVSTYNQVTDIIQRFTTRNSISKFLDSAGWDQVEWLVAEALRTCPPVCLFIDAVDEEFEAAPMYWMHAQLGLFYATMRFLRDTRLGNRLHLFVCLRDIVLAAVFRSENRTRYMDAPHIRVMAWDKDAIRLLLRSKISRLDSLHFLDPREKERSIENWLGTRVIRNTKRKIDEDIEDYLIRHTRLLPRDIIILGNHLCTSLSIRRDSVRGPIDSIVRRCVADIARILGDEQLTICANQIISDMTPSGAARLGYSEFYTSNMEYVRDHTARLKQLIDGIGKDRFTGEELAVASKRSFELFGAESDSFSVLWQNGLLGYVARIDGIKAPVFFSENKADEFQFPLNKREYVFHSVLIDSVGLRSVGRRPVF